MGEKLEADKRMLIDKKSIEQVIKKTSMKMDVGYGYHR
jgi:hypothetical protein